jgi:uracil phosphoribosyltransferase
MVHLREVELRIFREFLTHITYASVNLDYMREYMVSIKTAQKYTIHAEQQNNLLFFVCPCDILRAALPFPRFIPSANISKLNRNIEFTLLQH